MFQRAVLGAVALASALGLSGCGGSSAKLAASVNGHDISMSAFDQQVYYRRQVAVDTGASDQCQAGSPAAVCGQLKSSALTDLVDDELVQQYADKHHIAVSTADFNREWAQIFKIRFQSNPALLKAFSQRMRISQADVKARVKQDMLRQAVLDRVTTAPTTAPAIHAASLFVSGKRQADAVQAQLRSGTPFLTVARTLATDKKSSCASAGGCGDAGWVPTALLPPYQRFLMKARVGAPLGPFRLQQGFEFYLVEGRSRSFAMSASQQIALRGLAFSRWLVRQEQQSSIKRYAAT